MAAPDQPRPTKVLNFFGGPGSGKSTTASGVFFGMKAAAQHRVELVTEFAKEKVYEGAFEVLKNQQLVTSEQDHRQRRLLGQVEYVVTDSPLLLGCIYGEGVWALDEMHDQWWKLFKTYDNVNIWVDRVKPYQPYGRNQDEDQARLVDRRMRKLTENIIDFYVPGDALAPARVMQFLGLELPDLYRQQLDAANEAGRLRHIT